MKIEIDLNDVFGGGDGEPGETLHEAIRRQVVDALIRRTSEGLAKEVREKVGAVIDRLLSAEAEKLMPGLIEDLVHATYTPVDAYGRKGEPTTFHDQLLGKIIAQMEYKPSSDSYSRDKENAFTKAVRSVVDLRLSEFKKTFDKTVDGQFINDALAYATAKLRDRMGIKP